MKGYEAVRVAAYLPYREPRDGETRTAAAVEVRLSADAGNYARDSPIFRAIVREYPRTFSALRKQEGRSARSEVGPRVITPSRRCARRLFCIRA